MFDKENAKAVIIEFMKNNGKTDVINNIEEDNIVLLSANYHYGRSASDSKLIPFKEEEGGSISKIELIPFEEATKELIEAKMLVRIDGKLNSSLKPVKYYLDLTKI